MWRHPPQLVLIQIIPGYSQWMYLIFQTPEWYLQEFFFLFQSSGSVHYPPRFLDLIVAQLILLIDFFYDQGQR